MAAADVDDTDDEYEDEHEDDEDEDESGARDGAMAALCPRSNGSRASPLMSP